MSKQIKLDKKPKAVEPKEISLPDLAVGVFINMCVSWFLLATSLVRVIAFPDEFDLMSKERNVAHFSLNCLQLDLMVLIVIAVLSVPIAVGLKKRGKRFKFVRELLKEKEDVDVFCFWLLCGGGFVVSATSIVLMDAGIISVQDFETCLYFLMGNFIGALVVGFVCFLIYVFVSVFSEEEQNDVAKV